MCFKVFFNLIESQVNNDQTDSLEQSPFCYRTGLVLCLESLNCYPKPNYLDAEPVLFSEINMCQAKLLCRCVNKKVLSASLFEHTEVVRTGTLYMDILQISCCCSPGNTTRQILVWTCS